MPVLYKYSAPAVAPDNSPLLPHELRFMTLSASDPREFNDPFEVRPYFDQECHDHFARTHEHFYEKLGIKHSLLPGRSMVGLPTEHAVGFGEDLNKRFRDLLGTRFRVLCLSRTATNVLMWGHYTRSYAGIVLGLDTSATNFPKGLREAGFDIYYTQDRSRTKLPLPFYQSPSVEQYSLDGRIVNPPNQLIETAGGLVIPFSEYLRQMDEAGITALTTKAADWSYEKEVRYIYDLALHAGSLLLKENRHLIQMGQNILKEVIVGFRADRRIIRELVRLYRAGQIGKPRLFYTTCHPNLYEVQVHETDDQYLLDYFEIILPNQ